MQTNTITDGNKGVPANARDRAPPESVDERFQQLCQGIVQLLGREGAPQPGDSASPNHRLQAEAGRILRPHLEAGLREVTEVLREDLLVRIAYVQQLERLTEREHDSSSISRLLHGQSRPLAAPVVLEPPLLAPTSVASTPNLAPEKDSEQPSPAPPPENRFDGEAASLNVEQPRSSGATLPAPNSTTPSKTAPRVAAASTPSIAIEADLRQAAELWRQGDEERALALCSRTIQQNPSAAAHLLRGQMYAQRREYDRAIQDFTSAITLCPDHAKAYYHRARIYRARQEFDRAIADCTRSLQLQPLKQVEAYLQELQQLAASIRQVPSLPANAAEKTEAAPSRTKSDDDGKPPEDRGVSKKEASTPSREPTSTQCGYVTLSCEECGTASQVAINRLHRKFQCRKCGRIYAVGSDGKLRELVRPQSPQEQFKGWAWKGLRLAPVVGLFLLLFLGVWYGWRSFAAARSLSAFPNDLEPRAEILVKAWLNQDTERMQRLTTPAQEDRINAWLRAHPFPLSAEELKASRTWIHQMKIESHVLKEERDRVQLSIQVSTPVSAPMNLEQQWVRIGAAWYFQPFPDKRQR